jgi:uncharacterized protein YybS (DUF2232 family)
VIIFLLDSLHYDKQLFIIENHFGKHFNFIYIIIICTEHHYTLDKNLRKYIQYTKNKIIILKYLATISDVLYFY